MILLQHESLERAVLGTWLPVHYSKQSRIPLLVGRSFLQLGFSVHEAVGTSQRFGGDPKGFNSICNPSLWSICSLTIFFKHADSSLVLAIGARQPIVK